MTDNSWPDPERPGVPLNPEKDGWHWLRKNNGTIGVCEWRGNGWWVSPPGFEGCTSPKTTDPVRSALDTLWADLPYLMGRASLEGHAVGQALAQEWRAKIDAAIKEAADGKQV